MTQLQLNNLNVSIDKGQLSSFKKDDYEYIHQVGSPGWGKSDDEMFPIIGPTDEASFKVKTPKGEAILDQHGLLRELTYTLTSSTATTAVFEKQYTAGTKIKNSKFPKKSTEEWLSWPYDFVFKKQFSLSEDGLKIEFVINGEPEMPFMLGYHPAFKLRTEKPTVFNAKKEISLAEIMEVGSRAFQVPDCSEITLNDENSITLKSEGFGNFMLWTEVTNMVCVEPVSFYPYAVAQENLNEGFQNLPEEGITFTVLLKI